MSRRNVYNTHDSQANATCTCWFIMLVLNLTLGTYCFSYSLHTIFGKSVAWGWDLFGGIILGEVTIPLAVICKILTVAGMHVPFVK